MANTENSEKNILRNRAEEKLTNKGKKPDSSDSGELTEILHELQVHQIELELQNDELLRSQIDLESARTRLMRLYHNAPVGYVVLDPSGMILQANATFARMIGSDYRQLDKKPFAACLVREDESIFRGRFKAFFMNPENKRIDVKLKTPDKSELYVRLEAVPQRDEEKQPENLGYTELFMTVSDITVQVQNQKKLEHVNRILTGIRNVNQLIVREKDRSLLIKGACENLVMTRGFFNAWIVLLDPQGAFLDGSHAGADSPAGRKENYSRLEDHLKKCGSVPCMERAAGVSGVAVTRSPAFDCEGCPLASGYEGRAAMTIRLRHDQTTYGYLSLWVEEEMTSSEGQILVEEVARDLAFALYDIQKEEERTRALEALKASDERLAVTLRSIGDGVITTDTKGNVVIMNTVAEKLTGWTQAKASGKPLTRVFPIIHELTREVCANPVDKVLKTGEIIELSNHTMLIAKDGTERIIADSGAPIKNGRGDTIGVVLVFRDITEKQRLQEHLQQSEKLDSLGILAGGIAHDFNNLLSGIFGYIDMARDECDSGTEIADYLDRAISVYNRARDLTQQLLTFSKGGVPVRKPGDLSVLVKNSISFMLTGSNIACTYDIPRGIHLCEYDENQMGQVIDNMVLNAQQAMPLGGRISVSLRNVAVDENTAGFMPPGSYVHLSLTDEGVGIPQEIIGRIFDPFFSTKQKGSGLGLATCYSILQKHSGHIDVISTPGKGSTFNVYLPATDKKITGSQPAPAGMIRDDGTILIMDDEVFIREIASAQLRAVGYTVLEADNGEQALRIFKDCLDKGIPVKAAIFDLTIPGGMGGRETIGKIREMEPGLPVFASSGYSDDPVIARPGDFGFTDSIRKPYRKGELYDLLSRNLFPNKKEEKT